MTSTYSKRAYQDMADALLDVRRAVITTPISAYDARARQITRKSSYATEGALAAIDLIEQRIARIFELDNPRFDMERFAKWSIAGRQ